MIQWTIREGKKYLEHARLLHHTECSLQNALHITHKSMDPLTEEFCMISLFKYCGVFSAEEELISNCHRSRDHILKSGTSPSFGVLFECICCQAGAYKMSFRLTSRENTYHLLTKSWNSEPKTPLGSFGGGWKQINRRVPSIKSEQMMLYNLPRVYKLSPASE